MTTITYQIKRNDKVIKTISAKGMNSIYTKYNSYAKKLNSVLREESNVVGGMVWVLPLGEVLELVKVEN